MQDRRECTPEACPYAKGYYDRVRTALWDALDTHALTADALQMLARRHKVCPFELGLDLSLWCDVVIGDYNYLFDPVVHLERFFDTAGTICFCSMRHIIFRTAPGACTVPSLPKAPSTMPKAAGQGQKQPEKRTDKGQ